MGFPGHAACDTLLWPPQETFSSVVHTKPVDQASARQIPWVSWILTGAELGRQTPPLDSTAGAFQGREGEADHFSYGGASIHPRPLRC